MIINTKRQFFWSNIQKNLFSILLFATVIACTKKENLHIESIKTATGWGYTISNENKILIKQSVIPVISDTKSFATKEDALKVGDLVMQKLNKNISPTVTKNDLILLKIKT